MKQILGLGLVIVMGYVGFRLADPIYDAAARSICSAYAADRGLVLIEARGSSVSRPASGSRRRSVCSGASEPAPVRADGSNRLKRPTR
jgi:hypothetical protein